MDACKSYRRGLIGDSKSYVQVHYSCFVAITPTPPLSIVILSISYSLIKPLWLLLAMLLGKPYIKEKTSEVEEEYYSNPKFQCIPH